MDKVQTTRVNPQLVLNIIFIGEYLHNIDNKKRLAIPSKFRKEFGDKAVLTRGLDSCLFLYSVQEWQKFSEKLGQLSMGQAETRSFARLMLAGAAEVEFDNLGRVLIPDYLKNYAELKKKIIVAGVLNRLEIWDQERWARYKEEIEKNTDAIAEKLGELGLI